MATTFEKIAANRSQFFTSVATELPALTGTEKQIAFGQTCRATIVNGAERLIWFALKENNTKRAEFIANQITKIAAKHEDAAWWITRKGAWAQEIFFLD